MVKKEPKQRKNLDLSMLKSIGSGFKEVVVAAATHPSISALFIMTSMTSLRLLTGAYKEETEKQRKLSGELTGLYNGAQAMGLTAAVVPLAITGIQAVSSLAAMKKGRQEAPP